MPRQRTTASIARWVLAWFALTLAVAIAAPVVQPDRLQPICGAGAVKFIPQSDGQPAPAAQLTLDCALCAPAVVPPPPTVVAALVPPLPHAQPVFVDQESWEAGPPWRPSARAPPWHA
jgi:hypothetical protein